MISPIGSKGYDTSSVQRMRSEVADRILKQVDANQDGKVTEDELGKALESSGGKQSVSVAEIFKQLDQGHKGYITKQDIENGLAKADQGKSAQGQRPARGGGGGGPRAAKDKDRSSTTTYDPQDLNQDGTVTSQEKIQYLLSLYSDQNDAGSSNQTLLCA